MIKRNIIKIKKEIKNGYEIDALAVTDYFKILVKHSLSFLQQFISNKMFLFFILRNLKNTSFPHSSKIY